MNRTIVVVTVTFLAALVGGAEEPKDKGPARLDFKSLGVMLTDLGYSPKATDNNTFHLISATSKEFTHNVWLSISPDRQSVRLYNYTGLPDGFEKAPAGSWRRLLEQNDELTTINFSVDEPQKRLVARSATPNADLTAVQLRKAITGFVDALQQTKDVWHRVNFLPEMTADAKKALVGLAGTWKATEWSVSGKPQPAADLDTFVLTFDKNVLHVAIKTQKIETRVYLQIKDGVVWMDALDIAGATTLASIIKTGDGTLTLCATTSVQTRPTEFSSTEKNKQVLVVLKRARP